MGLRLRVQSALAAARSPSNFRGVRVGRDNTPRLQNNGQIFANSHPADYRRWLAAVVEQTRSTRPRSAFIDAWNKCDEGCCLEPDAQYGHGYPNATLRALNAHCASVAANACAAIVDCSRSNYSMALPDPPAGTASVFCE